MRRAIAALVVLQVGLGSPAYAYLKLSTRAGDRTVTLRWTRTPLRYFVTDRGVPGVRATELQQTVARAFDTWASVPTATLSFEFAGFVSAPPFDEDGISAIGFLDRPELERVLGATSFLVDTRTGEILESDIFFNADFAWSVAEGGQPGRFDLQSIAVHEIGHFLGLGHSAIGETELRPTGGRRVIAAETVMFPVAFGPGSTDGRELEADDIAGISDIYRNAEFDQEKGALAGTVTGRGGGIFGAHVVAFELATGRLVSNFTVNGDGNFAIAGLDPGAYVVRVEPIDDGDVESFFERSDEIDLDFRVTFHPQLAVVPRGGTGRSLEIVVEPK